MRHETTGDRSFGPTPGLLRLMLAGSVAGMLFLAAPAPAAGTPGAGGALPAASPASSYGAPSAPDSRASAAAATRSPAPPARADAVPAAAQPGPAAAPPAGTDAAALNDLVTSEMAFASASNSVGVKRAFLTWLADDAIVFRPGPVNARQWYAGRPESKASLSWYPAVAAASEAGDLGYTTGPYEFRAKGPDDTEVSYGSFVSVWRRQKDGSWKVVLDTGAESPRPEPPPPHWRAPGAAAGSPGGSGGPKAARKALTAPQRASERQSLFALDRGVCGQGGTPAAGSLKGAGGGPAAGDDTLVLRDGLPPATGKGAVQQAAATWARTRCEPSAGEVSASGDLGYIYGTFERRGAAAGAPAGAGGTGGAGGAGTPGAAGAAGGAPAAEGAVEKGYYLRIWSRQGRPGWRLALDVEMPLPPAAN